MAQGQSEKGWSFDRLDWDLIPKTLFKNKSWGKAHFELGAAGQIPQEAGVYVICTSQPNAQHTVEHSNGNLFGMLYTAMYVGMTDNLNRRFQEHLGGTPSENIMRTRRCFTFIDFWYHTTADVEEAKDLEGRLQRVLGPPAIRRFEGIQVIVSKRTRAFR